jgi:hypothetical protein
MKSEMNIRIPEIVINPELNKLKELNLFKEKVERATAFLKEHGVPKFTGVK